jgi:hypothetical protein
VIAEDQVFLMNTDELAALDGRYFGPIRSSAILSRAEPVLTFAKQRRCDSGASSEGKLVRPTTASSPHSGQFSVRSNRADAGLLASRHQSSPPRELKAPEIPLAARMLSCIRRGGGEGGNVTTARTSRTSAP